LLKSLLLFGNVYETYGEIVRAPPVVLLSKDANALELLAVLRGAVVEVLSTKWEVLLRAWVKSIVSSSSRKKKFALEAVIGVLGVLDTTWPDGV
jgi:hypothetical protein